MNVAQLDVRSASWLLLTSPLCTPTIVVAAVSMALGWISLLLRLWTRIRIVKTVGWDDKTMVIAMVFFSAFCVAVIMICEKVASKNGQWIGLSSLLITIQLLTVAEVFYVLSLLVVKISLAFFFLRVALEPWQRSVIYAAITVSTSFSVAMFWFVVFQCGMYHNIWEFVQRRVGVECASNAATLGMTYTHAAVSTITDWTFLLMPLFILRGSLMSGREKWSVALILMFAALGGIASIIRFKYIDGLAVPKEDFFPTAKNIAIWSMIEPAVGIICGCLATLRPLLRQVAPGSGSHTHGSNPDVLPQHNVAPTFRRPFSETEYGFHFVTQPTSRFLKPLPSAPIDKPLPQSPGPSAQDPRSSTLNPNSFFSRRYSPSFRPNSSPKTYKSPLYYEPQHFHPKSHQREFSDDSIKPPTPPKTDIPPPMSYNPRFSSAFRPKPPPKNYQINYLGNRGPLHFKAKPSSSSPFLRVPKPTEPGFSLSIFGSSSRHSLDTERTRSTRSRSSRSRSTRSHSSRSRSTKRRFRRQQQ